MNEGRKNAKMYKKSLRCLCYGLSRKRCKIDEWFLLKLDRKSYPLCQLVTLPTTLSAHNHTKSPHFLRLAPTSVSTKREYIEISNLVRKSQLADEKLPLKRVWSPSCDTF